MSKPKTIDARTPAMKIDDMHEQLQALCKRLEAVEGTVATGYIYPQTLPADAVIVIKHPGLLSQRAIESIKQGINSVWPKNKCLVMAEGLSMEVYVDGKPCKLTRTM